VLLRDAVKAVQKQHNEATEANNLSALGSVAAQYESLLNESSSELVLLFGLGTVKMQLGLNGLAINLFQLALKIKDLPEIWNNLGSALKAEHRSEEAKECWEKALSMREDPDYYNNMVTLYINEGNPEPGLEWAEKGLAIAPDHARLHWNYSLLLLELGRWREGFIHYDYGLLSKDRPARLYDKQGLIPWWDGSKGKRVVIYGEQGMGDEIMFASCIPEMMADCKEVIFDCHPRMVGLFERSFGVKCYGTRKKEHIDWPLKEKIDAKLAIGTLFNIYRSEGNFPKTPYLEPDAGLVKHYREKLEASGSGPYVGIAWSAGVKKTRNDLRSMKLKKFIPLMEMGGTFVSLQYTDGAMDKVTRFNHDWDQALLHWPEVVEGGPQNEYEGYNYDHTVALVAALDLCILPNTTAVHLCGALGKECWTVTPDACAWRYQFDREDMPMYSSIKQYRGENAFEQIESDYRRSWAVNAGEQAREVHRLP
jgi:tetratricopeptide (TPR) repeat protein